MLLASGTLAAAPLAAGTKQAFAGNAVVGLLTLTAAAALVLAALQTGTSAARRSTVWGRGPVAVPNGRTVGVFSNQTIKL